MQSLRFRRSIVVCALSLSSGFVVLAQEAFQSSFSARVGQPGARFHYEAMSYFSEDTSQRDRSLRLMRQELAVHVPLWANDCTEWSLHGRVSVLDLDGRVWLPGTWDRLPSELWRVHVGAGYRHHWDSGMELGVSLTLGSSSDEPFASGDELEVIGNAFLRVPAGERDAWMFYLNYASNREFAPHVPLPGVGYAWNPDDALRALVGLPLNTVYWEPLEGLTLEGLYFVPRTVNAEVGYRVVDPIKVYAGFSWDNDRYYRSGRGDDDDRLFYYEKRVTMGVRWEINRNWWVDLAGGFAWDRFFFEGEDYGDRGDHRVDIQDGPFVRLEVGLRL